MAVSTRPGLIGYCIPPPGILTEAFFFLPGVTRIDSEAWTSSAGFEKPGARLSASACRRVPATRLFHPQRISGTFSGIHLAGLLLGV